MTFQLHKCSPFPLSIHIHTFYLPYIHNIIDLKAIFQHNERQVDHDIWYIYYTRYANNKYICI